MKRLALLILAAALAMPVLASTQEPTPAPEQGDPLRITVTIAHDQVQHVVEAFAVRYDWPEGLDEEQYHDMLGAQIAEYVSWVVREHDQGEQK